MEDKFLDYFDRRNSLLQQIEDLDIEYGVHVSQDVLSVTREDYVKLTGEDPELDFERVGFDNDPMDDDDEIEYGEVNIDLDDISEDLEMYLNMFGFVITENGIEKEDDEPEYMVLYTYYDFGTITMTEEEAIELYAFAGLKKQQENILISILANLSNGSPLTILPELESNFGNYVMESGINLEDARTIVVSNLVPQNSKQRIKTYQRITNSTKETDYLLNYYKEYLEIKSKEFKTYSQQLTQITNALKEQSV